MLKSFASRRAILCGLEPEVATELQTVLRSAEDGVCTVVRTEPDHGDLSSADVVFCPFTRDLAALVEATNAPVVVVSRHPNVGHWLDAMEAGAADYCSAPFEVSQIRWILQGNMALGRSAAVAAL